MRDYLNKTISFFEELLSFKKIVIESVEFTADADEYDVDKYLTRKTLYFNKNTGVLYALCPLPSASLKFHKEIVKLESNVNFRWIVKSAIKKERFYNGGAFVNIYDKTNPFITTRFY